MGNNIKKFKHWYNHTDNGQIFSYFVMLIGTIITLVVLWAVFSIIILIDPSNSFYH